MTNKFNIDIDKVQKELYNSFNDFFQFSLNIIKQLDENENYYKFAVVNMQIALELFLKYYFVRIGEADSIIIEVKENRIKYEDFSFVLNQYYKTHRWSYGKKKEMRRILEIRNNIVHNGAEGTWNSELVKYIIRCIFFVHGTIQSDFGELLIDTKSFDLSQSKYWTEGAEEFIEEISEGRPYIVRRCLSCGKYTLVTKEQFDIGESTPNDIEDLVCINCFDYILLGDDNTIIDCYKCGDDSYFVHLLNPQRDNLYIGICSECGTDTWVRRCCKCHKFYHPSVTKESKYKDKHFCSDECLEMYIEENI